VAPQHLHGDACRSVAYRLAQHLSRACPASGPTARRLPGAMGMMINAHHELPIMLLITLCFALLFACCCCEPRTEDNKLLAGAPSTVPTRPYSMYSPYPRAAGVGTASGAP
jgi:hypothetical protein